MPLFFQMPCPSARVVTERKNEHGQSELALNELNFKLSKNVELNLLQVSCIR